MCIFKVLMETQNKPNAAMMMKYLATVINVNYLNLIYL